VISQDIRYGVRTLRKSPGFTLIAIALMAIAVAVNATVFSVVNALLLRPLPLPEPARVVSLNEMRRAPMGVAYPNYLDVRSRNAVLQDVAVYTEKSVSLSGAGQPEEVQATSAVENCGAHYRASSAQALS